jgi:3-oxoacyl-[acyl-carrier protein] reductase
VADPTIHTYRAAEVGLRVNSYLVETESGVLAVDTNLLLSDIDWEEASPEDWLELYAVNVVAVVRCLHGLLPKMREAGWGRTIQIGTGEALNPFPTMPDYVATKAALINLTVSLSKHLARTGITVNTVSPGIVVTPSVEQFYRLEASKRRWGDDWPAIEQHVLAEILDNPVGRLGRPEEVADLVAFVASPLSGYINGANLRIDGGSTAVI